MRRHARGFTLIELLIVIVIIGLLAAIAIPKFGSTKEKAYFAQMKSDLRNLATTEEAYLYEFGQYTNSFPPSIYTVSSGVTPPTINTTTNGWTAWVGHNVSTQTCAIFVGSVALAPADKEGEPRCTQ